ncbi:MAG: HAMP domain-containing protein [Nitrospirae bacterium]|nr:HAMP domain-containing protein [Nitrospirota bacterium]
MHLKIRTKLLSGFFAIIFPFLFIIGIIIVYNQNALNNAFKTLELMSAELNTIHDLRSAMEMGLMPGNDYLITGDKRYIDNFHGYAEDIENRLSDATDILIRLEKLEVSEGTEEKAILNEERIILSEVKTAWQNMRELSLRIFELPNPIGNRTAAKLMEEMDYKWAYPAAERLNKWLAIDSEEYNEALKTVNNVWERSWIIMFAGFTVLVVAGVLVSFYFAEQFTKPINTLTEMSHAVISGTYKSRADVKSGDELEQLAVAMNKMAEQIESLQSTAENTIVVGRQKTKDTD